MSLFGRRVSQCVCVAFLGCLGGWLPAGAQSPQQARVVEAVENGKVVALAGHVHPQARASNDRGALPDAQLVTRMHLLLNRGLEQEKLRQIHPLPVLVREPE